MQPLTRATRRTVRRARVSWYGLPHFAPAGRCSASVRSTGSAPTCRAVSRPRSACRRRAGSRRRTSRRAPRRGRRGRAGLCRRRIGAADAVVDHLDDDRLFRSRPHTDLRRRGVRVLDDVRERLRDDVVRGRLDRRPEPLLRHLDLDRERRARDERLDRGREAAVGEHGRVDAARELAQLVECGCELLARAADDRRSPRSGSVATRDSARRRETDSATRRCCAPSWRLRSSTRRASSAASMMRAREARISSSWRLRSVTSMPESSTSDAWRPVTSATGVAVHAITTARPSAHCQRRLALAASRRRSRPTRSPSARSTRRRGRSDRARCGARASLSGQPSALRKASLTAARRLVDAAVDDHRLAVDDDDEARDRLHQRLRDVALALELQLALLALGDVDAAGDDAARPSPDASVTGALRHSITRRSPTRVRERVLVLAPGRSRVRRAGTAAHAARARRRR